MRFEKIKHIDDDNNNYKNGTILLQEDNMKHKWNRYYQTTTIMLNQELEHKSNRHQLLLEKKVKWDTTTT